MAGSPYAERQPVEIQHTRNQMSGFELLHAQLKKSSPASRLP